ncbi:hypothetical protein H310_05554, partial [Aphanomyces invadans]
MLSGCRRFHTLGLHAKLVNALKAHGIDQPSQVQRVAIPAILDTRRPDVVVGAETGSGKTLSYILPLLERFHAQYPLGRVRKPMAVILVPNQELVKQIDSVLNTFGMDIPVACLTKTHAIPRHAAIVVGTPKAVIQHTSVSDLEFVDTIIVDEADMLLGGGFERDTKQVLGVMRNQSLSDPRFNQFVDTPLDKTIDVPTAPHGRQTIFSAATIPTYGRLAVSEYLKKKFPGAEYAITDNFHRTVPTLEQSFLHLDDSSIEARQELLMEILTNDKSRGTTLIFADSVASAKALHTFLEAEGLRCTMLHKDIPREERTAVLAACNNGEAGDDERHIVVATDMAARGLDLRHVNHVIQYEFATNVVAHIHRIGRTARAGATGKVTNIITKENDLVYKEIAAAGATGALTQGFSRRRSLRKKFKKASRPVCDEKDRQDPTS